MHITLIEPFYTGSHKTWADSLIKYSSHQIKLLSLEGRFWKWRMHGGAISLAQKFFEKEIETDLILGTDMLDLSLFLSLTRKKTYSTPTALYFHENQITYPWSPSDSDTQEGKDLHYGFINYSSALVADKIFFNSEFHRKSFLSGCENFLKKFPDNRDLGNLAKLEKKAEVLYLGVELSRFDEFRRDKSIAHIPLILWNHRWEYDKNPELFFETLLSLKREGLKFKICVLGQRGERIPDIFNDIPRLFKEELVHMGTVDNFSDYAKWLWLADIHPTTSNQDFFGISVVEGLYCECIPLLPRRLAYPEHIKDESVFYENDNDFKDKLRVLINEFSSRSTYQNEVSQYDWKEVISNYDRLLNYKNF